MTAMFFTSHPSRSMFTLTMARIGESGSSTLARASRATSEDCEVISRTCEPSPIIPDWASNWPTSVACSMVWHTTNSTGLTVGASRLVSR